MQENNSLCAVENFLSKFGMVFSRVKETIFKDFLDGLVEEGSSWEEFKSHFEDDGFDAFEEFLNAVVKKVGYDISGATENKEVYDLVKSVIVSSEKIASSVKQLFGDLDGKDFEAVIKSYVKEAESVKLDELLKTSDGNLLNSDAVPVDGKLGKLIALVNLFKELFDLIEKITDIEWSKVADEWDEFGKFVQDTYFTKEFGKRLVDYVLITFLKNIREVYEDDVKQILLSADSKIEAFLKELDVPEAEIASIVAEIKKYAEEIRNIEAQLKTLVDVDLSNINEKNVENAAQSVTAIAKAANIDVDGITGEVEKLVNASRVQLEAYKKVALQKLKAIVTELCPNYNSIAKVFDRIYAVLEFTGVIGKDKVDLVSYLKEKTDVIDDISGSPAGSLVEAGLDELAQIEIPEFHWEVVETIFTDPMSYLKEQFPLEGYDDVEKLISRVGSLIKAFNGDFPQIESIKQLLWDLLARVRNRLADGASEIAADIKQALENFENFLLGVLKIFEAIAVKTKKLLQDSFDQVKSDGENLIADLSKSVTESFDAIKTDVLKQIIAKAKCAQNGLPEHFKKIVLDSLYEAASENVQKCYQESNIEEVKKKLETQLKDQKTSLESRTSTFVNDFQDHINEFFSKDTWKNRYDAFVEDLKTEFKKQTAAVPSNLDEIKEFGENALDSLLKGESIKNPFSDFEPSAFYQIVMDHLTQPLDFAFVDDCKSFVTDAKGIIETACSEIKSILKVANVDAFDLKKLALHIAQSWLEKIKSKFMDMVVRPYINALKSVVKDWVATILAKVAAAIQSKINELIGNVADLTKCIEVDEIKNAMTGLMQLKEEAEDIDSWHDGLKFAYHLYQCIPSAIKEKIPELIGIPVTLPKIQLPKYSFDATNKLLAVNIWDFENKGNAKGDAEVSIQLVLCAGEREIDGSAKDGLYLLPIVKGSYAKKFNVGSKHFMAFSAAAKLNEVDLSKADTVADELQEGKLGFFFNCGEKGNVNVYPLADEKCISAYLKLGFERGQVDEAGKETTSEEDKKITLFDTSVASMTIGNYPQSVFVGYDDGFDVGYSGSVEKVNLILKLKEQNSFFNTILQDDISFDLDKLNIQYSLKKGFQVENDLHIRIPVKKSLDLNVVKFDNIAVDLGLTNGDLSASVLTSFTADLKGIAISFANLGIGASCNVFGEGGKRGSFKFSPEITYPNGIGISIDVSAVKGAGAIQWDKDKGRFFGAVELSILDKIGASTMLLFTTGKGKDPFSFAGAVCVYFNPGIQLGMGFSLNGIGGSLGVNRMLSTDSLRDAVYDGSLESVLFFKDIDKNFDKVLENIDKFYPIKKDQVYFGFLGKLAWGTILSADFGLFIQAPSPVTIVVAGVVKVSVSESADKLLKINASFMGGIEFDKGIFFDASLYDSMIVGLELHGDMAMRIYWGGDTKGFILSIGGFHPQYTPEAGFNLPDMKRVGVKLDYKILKLSLDSYFAITSNSVQFGSRMDMKIGWDKFGLIGYAGFNALFQFNPFKFIVDMCAGLAVKVGSMKVCSIDLEFELGGPAQWHAKGTASFWFLFVKIKVGFNETWGKKQNDSNKNRIDVLPLFTSEFFEKNNWKLISSDLTDNLVNLNEIDKSLFVLQPSDSFSFVQSAVPLDEELECYGNDEINDYKKIEISSVYIGEKTKSGASYEKEDASFAPSLTKELSEKEKLSAKSFEKKQGGFKYSIENTQKKSAGTQKNIDVKVDGTQNVDAALKAKWKELYTAVKGIRAEKTAEKKSLVESSASRKLFRDKLQLNVEKNVGCISTKCSYRRNADGFKRYVKQMDNILRNGR